MGPRASPRALRPAWSPLPLPSTCPRPLLQPAQRLMQVNPAERPHAPQKTHQRRHTVRTQVTSSAAPASPPPGSAPAALNSPSPELRPRPPHPSQLLLQQRPPPALPPPPAPGRF